MIRRRVLFRCDGGALPEIGTGHVVRCLALARDLAEVAGTAVAFCMREGAQADRVRAAGFPVLAIREGEDAARRLREAADEHGADVVCLDDLGASAALVPALRADGRIVVAIDDPAGGAGADLSWTAAFPGRGARFEGLDRTILPGAVRRPGATRAVLASFGGHDPGDCAARFLRAWVDAAPEAECVVAVGAGHPGLDALRGLADRAPRARVVVDADLVELLPHCALAVTNGGTTMLLCAAFGVPTLAVAQYEHQLEMARRLEATGAARARGRAAETDFDALVREARELLADAPARRRMSEDGRAALPGLGRRDAVQALTVVEPLPWDSNFFGREIATLHPRVLTPAILGLARERCAAAGIECLYVLCDARDAASLELARMEGLLEVDDRLTYAMRTRDRAPVEDLPGVRVRPGRPADASALAAIAGVAYGASRYFHDPNFPTERCRQFYRDWILRSLEGRFDDAVLVAEVDGEPAGYVSCRALTANLGSIGLVGLAEAYRGRGLARRLLGAALEWFAAHDLPVVEVVTQGRNAPARRLYESSGFALRRHEVWFHEWFASATPAR